MPTLRPVATPFPEVSDLVAIDEVVRGNREMFEVLVRRYNQQLYRVGMGYLRNHAQTEDAMQNAYLKAFLHLARFDRRSAFATWLTRIMINECLMVLRKPQRRLEQRSLATEELPAESTPGADQEIAAKEMKTLLEQAIGALPQNYRVVYLLREVQQLSTEETAKSLGISTDSVKVTLHRARERLKRNLLESAAAVELFEYSAPWCDPMTARVLQLILAVKDPLSDTAI